MSDAFNSITDRESWRGQFHLSVLMVIGMAIGAFILGFATPIAHAQKATIVNDGAPFSGRLVSLIDE